MQYKILLGSLHEFLLTDDILEHPFLFSRVTYFQQENR